MKENNVEKNLTAGSSHLLKVSTYDVEKILRSIDSKKSTGIDKIPPKLIKVSANDYPLQLIIVSTKGCFQIMLR